jgi:thiamine transport system substrate-binding protein
MRKLLVVAALAFVLLLGNSASSQPEGSKLVVYTYDSFVSYGPAGFIKQEFEKRFGVTVEFVASGPSREMLARLLTEREAAGTPADVFLGELNDIPKAKKFNLFEPLTETDVPNLSQVPEDLRLDPDNTLIPYEHGFITLVYDSEKLSADELPRTFPELLASMYRDQLIVQDPRTSSVGHAFLFWTIYNFGEDFTAYWQKLLPNILSIFPGWSAAYNAFTKGEAPLVVSFSTDACFDSRYKPLLLEGQAYRTVFGAGVVKGTDNPRLAREFIDLLLSIEVQEKLPDTEVMFPANAQAKLPEAWQTCAVTPTSPAALPLSQVAENDDRWLQQWAEVVVGSR